MRKEDINPAVFFQTYAEKMFSERVAKRMVKGFSSLRGTSGEASDEEIERVMVMAAGESSPSAGSTDEIMDDTGLQEIERTQNAPSPCTD